VEKEQMPKLGNILKEARLAKEMTLEDLSTQCGYSKALISRIENNSVSPSIASLTEISASLGLKLHEVFTSFEAEEPVIVKQHERQKFSGANGKLHIEFLANGTFIKKMQPLLLQTRNGSRGSGESHQHEGEEFLHVLSGRAEVAIGDDRFILGPGDSIHFKSSIPHRYRRIGKGKTLSLKVTYPPCY
jgi:transcriptional regulator with XRE-family HTH domain